MNLTIRSGSPLRGQLRIPGDKSIAHRSVLLGALAGGVTQVQEFPPAGDPMATVDAVRQLGIEVVATPDSEDGLNLAVHGQGLCGLRAPAQPINCRNAGTAMRLLAGILAGQPFSSVLDGSEQLRRRPMRRVIEPLREMGALITDRDGHAPLAVTGRPLHGVEYRLPVASAQVKSAVILAALFADGTTVVHEPGPTRDYTERMMRAMGADVQIDGFTIVVRPLGTGPLAPLVLRLPGDFSSAAFPLVAGLLVAKSDLLLANVGVNPTRTGLLDVLAAMGADVAWEDKCLEGGEPVAALHVRPAELQGTTVAGDTVVRMIDEFPVFAVAATQARGTTLVRDAAELRVKEVDRISRLAEELRKLGAQIEEQPDGFVIEGPTPLRGAVVDSHGDHRLAMALVVAGMIAKGETTVLDAGTASDSFPGFARAMAALGAELHG